MSDTIVLKTKTVHCYNFKKYKEYVVYDDIDFFRADGFKKPASTGRAGRISGDVSKRDRGITIARAKKTLRRIALHNQLERLLTLTTRDNITDHEYLDKLFKQFVFRLRAKYPDFQYIGTRERQERGAVHYHLLINRFIPQKVAYQIWIELLRGKYTVSRGKDKGQIRYKRPDADGTTDFRLKRNGKHLQGIEAINYLIKYVGKSISEPFVTKKGFNSKAYLCSTNLDRNYKLTRSVIRFYIQMQEEYNKFENYMQSLYGSIKKKASKLIFDNPFKFEMDGEVKYGTTILIQTG